jgi:hypothetical protein
MWHNAQRSCFSSSRCLTRLVSLNQGHQGLSCQHIGAGAVTSSRSRCMDGKYTEQCQEETRRYISDHREMNEAHPQLNFLLGGLPPVVVF